MCYAVDESNHIKATIRHATPDSVTLGFSFSAILSRALCYATLGDSVTSDYLTNSYNNLFEGISKVKTPAVKAFKATYQGRYTLRDCEGEPLSMTAMETITDLLLEIMEVT